MRATLLVGPDSEAVYVDGILTKTTPDGAVFALENFKEVFEFVKEHKITEAFCDVLYSEDLVYLDMHGWPSNLNKFVADYTTRPYRSPEKCNSRTTRLDLYHTDLYDAYYLNGKLSKTTSLNDVEDLEETLYYIQKNNIVEIETHRLNETCSDMYDITGIGFPKTDEFLKQNTL